MKLMDIYIIYVIKTLLLPISSLLIISIAGLLLLSHQKVLAMILLASSLSILLLLSLPWVTKHLASTQEIYPPLIDSMLNQTTAQAIIVLGGGLRYPAPEYPQEVNLKSNTLVRIRYAARLAKKTQLPLLVSGGSVFETDLPSEATLMSQVLINEFNQAVKWQEGKSHNTAENAAYSYQILNNIGVQRIILVTHALHMRRAVEQFEKQGFQVIPAPTDFLSWPATNNLFNFLPSAKALEKSTLVIHEVMGRVWYKLRY